MDHGSFDRIARLLGSAGSRRAAIGALFGAGAVAATEAVAAKKNRKNRRSGKKGRGGVSAQAVCPPPDNGVNRSNCNYTGQDFSGQDISSSAYRNTIFRNATLIETDLSSSNARGANFRNANLCGADLSSSTLRDANFHEANLAFADLSSSACGGATFTAATFFCGTRDCNGNLRNDDCAGGVPSDLCCTMCGANEACVANECECQDAPNISVPCGDGCLALSTAEGGPCFCGDLANTCAEMTSCTDTGDCDEGFACVSSTQCSTFVCVAPCGLPTAAERRSSSAQSGQRPKP